MEATLYNNGLSSHSISLGATMESITRILQAKKKSKAALLVAIALVVMLQLSSHITVKDSQYLRVEVVQTEETELHLPATLDLQSQRALSLNLGGGNCKWQPPVYTVPEDIDFYKTVIAGFPSGDKRMIFVQMEALTGWPAKDEWDFEHLGMSNHPFIKANYPHHEGVWGWGDVADQVVMMVRNIRRSMVSVSFGCFVCCRPIVLFSACLPLYSPSVSAFDT